MTFPVCNNNVFNIGQRRTVFFVQTNDDVIFITIFFELAVAVAITLFGTTSPAALATTVGVLTEVPVMLALVKAANNTKGWFKS